MLSRLGLAALYLLISRTASASDVAPERVADASFDEHSVVHDSQAARNRRTSWTGDRLALLAHIGIGAPGGALGADLDIAPIPYFAVAASSGISFGGPQFALMPRLRIPVGDRASRQRTFLTFGAGPSFGRYVNGSENAGLGCLLLCALEQNGESKATQTFEHARWYNLELGLDAYGREGRGYLRTTLGYGWISNDHDYTCRSRDSGYPPGGGCDRRSGQALAFFTLAYGFAL
jgi:hypothetical protein